ncbi:MAG: DEAD/DEAH box helicase [Bacteroidales bacterium]|nr:DEAD/DEAH box helicase [Bacteroidales bacterium]
MKAFELHRRVLDLYKEYLLSFINIKDRRIADRVKEAVLQNAFIPEPLIQFNPSYKIEGTLQDFVSRNNLHPDLARIFKVPSLFKHQEEAIKIGANEKGFVVTSGTGSGKSLIFFATIFNYILKLPEKKPGIKAVIVYPMNALINSQQLEIEKYASDFGSGFPITYAKYTGQEDADERQRIKDLKPDIILTNYMMLELIMTRQSEEWMREVMRDDLHYLVFDELHTYRGRQGSDVAMLIRRIRNLAHQQLICIGTSATMATEGDTGDRKQAIADVAFRIFGDMYQTDQIIEEYLEPCTQSLDNQIDRFTLQEAIHRRIDLDADENELIRHPLAIWLENKVALQYNPDGTIQRGKPKSIPQIAQMLITDSGEPERICLSAIMNLLEWAEILNMRLSSQGIRKSYLPFKLHQFISQTSTVYVTLDPVETRKISIESGRYVKDESKLDQLIYPILFSRYSGHEFICVRLDFENMTLQPREPEELPYQWIQSETRENRQTGKERREMRLEDFPGGYLIVQDPGEPDLWTDEQLMEMPASWWKIKNDKPQATDFYKYQLPRKIWFNTRGDYGEEPSGTLDQWGWYIPAKLIVDPTAGIIYDHRTSENTKLMRLGNEGRSTATTLLSYVVVMEMHHQKAPPADQKLLSFTDNRQDASLQSGHFNDFITTGQLRSAVYHALRKASGHRLKAYEIARHVSEHLSLKEKDYVPDNRVTDYPDPENQRALETFLLIRILYDLRRGWRFNLPNLEQTGLLNIGYQNLDVICQDNKIFEELFFFDALDPQQRYDILLQVLNYFRTSYAIDYPLLTRDKAVSEGLMSERLDPAKLWGPDIGERIETPSYLVLQKPGKTRKDAYMASIGAGSYLGKYLRRKIKEYTGKDLDKGSYLDFILKLCEKLRNLNFLVAEEIRGDKATIKGYRLRLEQVVWELGDGNKVLLDEIRYCGYIQWEPKPNSFFKQFYQQDFSALDRQLVGREHTGQMDKDIRIIREEGFRQGQISALFCSPTMELGIDIAKLNIVHMRNVPPTPANYAQRGGRAGRSGQTALIFTYCSQWSPHDRNYFKKPTDMVSGSVVPPRLEINNEELILSHFNAYLLMRCGISDLHISMEQVLDISQMPALPIRERVMANLQQGMHDFGEKWTSEFAQVIKGISPELEQGSWFNQAWLTSHQKSFITRFDRAFDRWRILFLAAENLLRSAQEIVNNPTVKDSNIRKQALNDQYLALKQRDLLLNQSRDTFGSQSEFYIFRYLASEGFLPGYNFTRLPIRTFVGERATQKGGFISRSRFIALKEFGPGNLIYHNGQKYRIKRLLMADAGIRQQKIKTSKETGYAFLGLDADHYTNDPITNNELTPSRSSTFSNVIEMSETEAFPENRISCEEEERTSQGYEISSYFNYPKGMESNRQAVIKAAGQPLLNLIFGPATQLIEVNERWRRAKDRDGFWIDDRNGRWLKQVDLEDEETKNHAHEVRIFTTDIADSLYIQPVAELGLTPEQVHSLAYALKRGIEQLFQVEESEIGVMVLGEATAPNILLFESSEGSLGILSQLVDEPKTMRKLFRESYAAMHFDPETYEDTRPDLPKANYDDLLSYYNQRVHDQMDRFDIKEVLERLMECSVETKSGKMDREQLYHYLLSRCDPHSSTERQFVEYLYVNGYVLPDKSQVNIPECYVNADFIFNTLNGPVLIFCDGSVHDNENVKEQDRLKRKCLRDAGYDLIQWYYKRPLEEIILQRKDIFRIIQ